MDHWIDRIMSFFIRVIELIKDYFGIETTEE